ncbi:DeoR/GlpR family DNA-binding transcription regulator [Microlunatus parietis]|uniref:Lactose phosphotransferase system repressor n=1 Tax=Microlunatus parietis TaxID=682979 RepID=A0A7Y9I447_9ACTN|nr:DeoR/GlpR family DNA-binding transcription regulator [Microlunatus parietis]NYE69640.1 DeoR/GlpR family transcriptional regulator of sugar metabolism [Microlunatus parietis]
MRAEDRQSTLAAWLAAEGRIDVITAADRLGVAPETIRRDLRVMERSGLLRRVHGGAVTADADPIAALGRPATVDPADLDWVAAVWALLPRTGTVLLGTGEPTLTLAKLIVTEPDDLTDLTIVTNSLDAALVLSRAPGLSVYNLGGTVSTRTRAQEGDWALTELRRLHTDVSVICPAGLHPDHGLTQQTPAAAAVSEAEVEAGTTVVALIAPESLGTTALVRFAPLESVDVLAVAGIAPDRALRPYREAGIKIITPGPRTEQGAAEPNPGAIVGA